jgi:hypothetical protein
MTEEYKKKKQYLSHYDLFAIEKIDFSVIKKLLI